ncbi:hypothetical protein ACTOB_003831 [Actinoplanes oblitus]|uniref:Uncharacterized protein n=1 Tax=Actinoplanes oblitus TaxID=3040509 RepID=A0ABY8WTD2_9ACTN|nr:hypothetical protein [Actinoplanes oblitus]WIN00146.1 hypothetical protein ACTOB_003831 [Actinoplanes oblitus]
MPVAHDALDDPFGGLLADDAGVDVGLQAAPGGARFVRALSASATAAVAKQPAGRVLLDQLAAPLARRLQWPFRDDHAPKATSLTSRRH